MVNNCFYIATHKCNIKCDHCIDLINPGEKEYQSLVNFDLVKKFCLYMEINNITFTGGEPTILNKLPEMIKSAIEVGITSDVITNGTKPEVIEKIKEAGIKGICISMDGMSQKTHGILKKSDIEIVKNTINKVVNFKISSRINCVLHTENLDEIKNIITFAKENKVNDVIFSPLTVTKSSLSYLGIESLPDEKFKKFKKDLIIWGHMYKRTKYVQNFLSLYDDKISKPNICNMAKNGFVIDEYGTVYPCFSRMDINCGNIQSDDFEKIKNELINVQKEIRNAKCFNKHCLTLDFPFERN